MESASVPFWLVALTGGGIVGASFLFTTLMTDHGAIRQVNGFSVGLPWPARETLVRIARGATVGVLLAVVVAGLLGPHESTRNPAILLVWVGWWAGYTMSVYLLGNTWPALNPWRGLAGLLARARERTGEHDLPDWGAWPAAVGLLALVWVEVVTPVSANPRLLATAVVGYTAVTLAGAARYGTDAWFDRVDPVAAVFRWYGRVAPIQRTDDGIAVRLPGTALVGEDGADETPFVVALLWVTTYDGLISTPAWARLVRPLAEVGVPPLAVYLAGILGGFALFLAVYRLAARSARRTADTYVSVDTIRRRFVPALVPIAAGYHAAHFLGYFLGLVPVLVAVLANPLAPPTEPTVMALPGWFGGIELAFVILGHLLAIWIAHAVAFDTFTGRLQPIRSQYAFVVVMIFYTMTSMWVVAQPFSPPPYV